MSLTIGKIAKQNTPIREVATFVFKHLLKQKVRSTGGSVMNGCLYHSPDGLSCAVGCLIPATINTERAEFKSADHGLAVLYSENTMTKLDNRRVLDAFLVLQSVHDKLDDVNGRKFSKAYFREGIREYFSVYSKDPDNGPPHMALKKQLLSAVDNLK